MLHQVAVLAYELRLPGSGSRVASRGSSRSSPVEVDAATSSSSSASASSACGLLLDQELLDRFDVGARWRAPVRVAAAPSARSSSLRLEARRGPPASSTSSSSVGSSASGHGVLHVRPRPDPQARCARILLPHVQMQPAAADAVNAVRPVLGHSRPMRLRGEVSRRKMRTQETFGAATPGRRVLYSASWVLRRRRRGGDAHETYVGPPRTVNPAPRKV